jgi:hypothetical protein
MGSVRAISLASLRTRDVVLNFFYGAREKGLTKEKQRKKCRSNPSDPQVTKHASCSLIFSSLPPLPHLSPVSNTGVRAKRRPTPVLTSRVTVFRGLLNNRTPPPGRAWRADAKTAYRCGFGIRLYPCISFLSPRAALFLKMEFFNVFKPMATL